MWVFVDGAVREAMCGADLKVDPTLSKPTHFTRVRGYFKSA